MMPEDFPPITVVVAAAGKGVRFRQENKLLAPFRGRTAFAACLKTIPIKMDKKTVYFLSIVGLDIGQGI